MQTLIQRAKEVRRERGTPSLLRRSIPGLYNRLVWPFLPEGKPRKFGGVPVGTGRHRWFDSFVPWRTPSFDRPEYEQPLLAFLRDYVKQGDHVVIVGGGHGVSAVIAANSACEDGRITVFEASREFVDGIQETLRINGVEDQVRVSHTVVGTVSEYAESEYGSADDATVVSPAQLPECDVLELDCEGAELNILDDLEIRPRTIIVETHSFLDSPQQAVRERLRSLDYRVTGVETENENLGIDVLVAVRSNES